MVTYDASYPPAVLDAYNSPKIGSFSPSSVVHAVATTVTVNGSKFTASSVVKQAGTSKATTFISPTQISASINAPTAGTIAITVTDGSKTSAPVNLTVT